VADQPPDGAAPRRIGKARDRRYESDGRLLYGAAERLDLVQKGVSIWVLNSIVLWLYLVLASVAWMRRGVGNPLVASEANE